MGLIKAAVGAISSTMHDQWKDLISCENMDNDTLMVMKTTDTGVISKKSVIRVMPGQCAVILQNGKVLDASAEEGDYTFDESVSPSFFAGNFGAVFKEMWQRFTFGGTTVGKQAVYYFNTKEIMDNKFGTVNPVPYQDWSHPIPNQMTGGVLPLSVNVKCHGTYTFKIVDPALFMHEIAGTATVYKKDQIVEQMRSEVISVFQNVVNELGTDKYKVPVLELPSQTDEIKEIMDEKVFDEPIRKRGLSIVVFAIMSVILDEESQAKIDNYNLSANAHMQQGTLVGAYADAVKNAAKGGNGGNGGNGNGSGSSVVEGFMGMAMMNMASNGMFSGATANAANQAAQNTQQVSPEAIAAAQRPVKPEAPVEEPKAENTWVCPKCGKENTGKFCEECGEKRPEPEAPEAPETIKCPKCGKELPAGTKFCPECR